MPKALQDDEDLATQGSKRKRERDALMTLKETMESKEKRPLPTPEEQLQMFRALRSLRGI
jgi:hypothetical protein